MVSAMGIVLRALPCLLMAQDTSTYTDNVGNYFHSPQLPAIGFIVHPAQGYSPGHLLEEGHMGILGGNGGGTINRPCRCTVSLCI